MPNLDEFKSDDGISTVSEPTKAGSVKRKGDKANNNDKNADKLDDKNSKLKGGKAAPHSKAGATKEHILTTKAGFMNEFIRELDKMSKEEVEEKLQALVTENDDEDDDDEDEDDEGDVKVKVSKGDGKDDDEVDEGQMPDFLKKKGDDDDDEDDVDEEDDDDEDDEKVKKSKKYESVRLSKDDLDVSEDIAAIFKDSGLSKEFITVATDIFETAVITTVNAQLEKSDVQMQEAHETILEVVKDDLSTQLDKYLDYVADTWMEENELAVERGLKAELTENLLVGLKALFEDNYVTVPEDKVDIVDELAEKVEELEKLLNTEMSKNYELRDLVDKSSMTSIVDEVCEDLSMNQREKIVSLSENIDYENEDDFKNKIDVLKETYFSTGKTKKSTEDDSLSLNDENDPTEVAPEMARFVDAINRSVKT